MIVHYERFRKFCTLLRFVITTFLDTKQKRFLSDLGFRHLMMAFRKDSRFPMLLHLLMKRRLSKLLCFLSPPPPSFVIIIIIIIINLFSLSFSFLVPV